MEYSQQIGAYYFSCICIISWLCFCAFGGILYLYDKIKKK